MGADNERYGLLIYIAGPYTPNTTDLHDAAWVVQHNVDNAIDAAIAVINKGHFPYIPHLSHYIHLRMKDTDKQTKEWWYNFDMNWLKKCDALFYLGKSQGADAELKYAKEHNYIIFYSLNEIPDAKNKKLKRE